MSSIQRDLNLRDSHIRTFNYRNLRRLDWFLLAVAAALAVFGLTALYSASQNTGPDTSLLEIYYVRQGIAFFLGLVIALGIVCIDYRALISLAPVMYVVIIGLLVAVLFFGRTAMGGQHWLPLIGPFNLQPSEASKLVLVYSLAWYLSLMRERAQSIWYFVGAFMVGGGVLILILAQRDLGRAFRDMSFAWEDASRVDASITLASELAHDAGVPPQVAADALVLLDDDLAVDE